jgi:ComF family protein
MCAACLSHLLPEDCRVCGDPLTNISRIPVCAKCLAAPQPFLADVFCARCRTPFLNDRPLDDAGLCGLCRTGASGFDAAYSYGAYDQTLRALIHLFKYHGVVTLAAPLGGLLARALPREEPFDAIVPMPLHWRRRLHRGFNQCGLLARELSRRSGIPVEWALRRRRATPAQAGLTHAARRRNVAGAFRVPRPESVAGKRLLLIDDVLTTGSTLSAAAGVLRRAGARHVAALTVARVDRRPVSFLNPVAVGGGSQ